jgi:ABC-type uncharacterized transport system involved in gliding motility auxiliary subunit
MELKKAKNLISEMIDICLQIDDQTLYEATQGIYGDVQAAKSIDAVITSARELMVFVNEVDLSLQELVELKDDIESIFNKLLEEAEDFE